ncbi:MAG: hypothetical protein PHX93_04465 [Candidatus Peribacteraceae bacterium]|jgi:REP element-mobilizing transposase RayT|nr:hypothetical protein [Candidatus Peribacteraceae bacterium]
MDLFRNTYRTTSNRKRERDYALPGRYFVTICAADHALSFGKIHGGIMGLNDMGCIVADEIQCTPAVRPNVAIDDWIVMPDHVHMVVTIHESPHHGRTTVETSRRDVSTNVAALIPLFRFRPRSLGAVINHIKSACTRRIRTAEYAHFMWQPNYHDRIIRSNAELHRIRRYIEMNPRRWKCDTDNRTRK